LKRRKDQDLTQLFKILNEINKVEPEEIPMRRREPASAHKAVCQSMELTRKQARNNLRLNRFGLSVVDG
jgi:hypothetical protein